MTALALAGGLVAAWVLIGLAVVCVREREARQAVAEFLLALVVGPALLTAGVFLRHRAPRAIPLSAEALERWARQTSGHTGERERSAWVLAYRGRGLIVVRRRRGTDYLNDVPTRASRAREDTKRARR